MSDRALESGPANRPDAPDLATVAAEIEREFPLVTRRTGLVLFDVDPHRLQAQWQVETGHLEQARGAFPPAADVRLQLRLLRPEARGNDRLAAVVSPPKADGDSEGTAVFDVSDHGALYQAELGLASADGGWLLLARSNSVRLPGPVGGTVGIATARAEVSQAQMQRATAESPEPAVSNHVEFHGTLHEPSPRAAPGGLSQETPRARQPLPFDPTLSYSGFSLAPVFPDPLRGPGWSPDLPFLRVITALEAPVAEADSVPLPVSSARQRGASKRPSPSSLQIGSTELPSPSPRTPPEAQCRAFAEDMLPVFPLYDPSDSVSSPAAHEPSGRVSTMELNAELLLHGKATPGSWIEVFGLAVEVAADGRFLLRRALDAGMLPRSLVTDSQPPDSSEPESE
jgi:hypothetical protein